MKAICGLVSTQAVKCFKLSLILFSLSKVTRNHIPEDVFESWSTQIHVVGTDIESEGSGNENSDDGDMTNDDEVIDLSSSVIDLGINGSGIPQ